MLPGIRPILLAGDFIAEASKTHLVGDTAHLCIDVGEQVADHMLTSLAIDALKMVHAHRQFVLTRFFTATVTLNMTPTIF
ncbi:MAG: hypothetical protein WD360_07550 [Nitriliruptoraceae bacterium]